MTEEHYLESIESLQTRLLEEGRSLERTRRQSQAHVLGLEEGAERHDHLNSELTDSRNEVTEYAMRLQRSSNELASSRVELSNAEAEARDWRLQEQAEQRSAEEARAELRARMQILKVRRDRDTVHANAA